MRRIAQRIYATRYVTVTAIVVVVAAILPLVAFAGDGDPRGG